jgi:F420-non-reducing hydrogenase iron-sulfur subunit
MTEAGVFQPKILGFLCNWCSYAGADLAGVSRFQYPPTIRIVRVMCSGRVDPVLVLRAFSRGADGVMVLGCHPGDCHYATGNYYALARAKMLGRLLQLAGINPDRLALDWVSAGEGRRFAELVTEFTEQIAALGPLGQSEGLAGDKLEERLAAASRTVQSPQIRWLIGRRREMLDKGDVYGQAVSEVAFDELIESSLAAEYLRSRLLLVTADRPQSVKEMAAAIGVIPKLVLPHVVALEQSGLMAMVGIEGRSPKYQRA